tara:strand:- start:86 stop:655 length:570 start_codon:yes stop_codon:yes gene_type:complete
MEIPGAATPGFCQKMIDKYEADVRKRHALVGPEGRVEKGIRSSVNLEMNYYDDWAEICSEVRRMIFDRLGDYVPSIHQKLLKSLYNDGYDSSYSLLKYEPGPVGYDWHNDFLFDDFSPRGGVRTITWLFYLNECEGGETEFYDGTKIKCETGKLVFFPSTWCMLHRGCPVLSGVKYIAVGWIYSRWNAK